MEGHDGRVEKRPRTNGKQPPDNGTRAVSWRGLIQTQELDRPMKKIIFDPSLRGSEKRSTLDGAFSIRIGNFRYGG